MIEQLEAIIAGSNSPHVLKSESTPFRKYDVNGTIVIEVLETIELVHQPYAARSERNVGGHAPILIEEGFYVVHTQKEYNPDRASFVDNVD